MAKNAIKVKIIGILTNKGMNEVLKDIKKRADMSNYPATTFDVSIQTLIKVLDEALKEQK